ncbi:DUF6036 family nucleotidyltransferase [Rhodoflexus sp.]
MIDTLKDTVTRLEQLEIPYMLSGSIALITYTTPRMTRDIDIVIELMPEHISKFVMAFQQNYYCHQATVEEEVVRKGMFNIIDYKTGYKVDFIVRKNSEYRIKEFERRQRTNVLGVDVWLVSLEDLILSKLIWIQDLQSDRQKEDIQNLLANDDVDTEYLKFWIHQLKLNTFNLL